MNLNRDSRKPQGTSSRKCEPEPSCVMKMSVSFSREPPFRESSVSNSSQKASQHRSKSRSNFDAIFYTICVPKMDPKWSQTGRGIIDNFASGHPLEPPTVQEGPSGAPKSTLGRLRAPKWTPKRAKVHFGKPSGPQNGSPKRSQAPKNDPKGTNKEPKPSHGLIL